LGKDDIGEDPVKLFVIFDEKSYSLYRFDEKSYSLHSPTAPRVGV
jgi:hypothetical protein